MIDGVALADEMASETAARAAAFRAQWGRAPGLYVVLVGDNPASARYVRSKQAAAQRLGIDAVIIHLAADSTTDSILGSIRELNESESVDAILVQMPLPEQVNPSVIIGAVRPTRDVDGFHPTNMGLLAERRPYVVPCTPAGCLALIEGTGTDLFGKRAVVVGRSAIVGLPLMLLLNAQDATVTLCHRFTRDLREITRQAEVLVVAAGVPGLIHGEDVAPGAVVIDVGQTRVEGKLVGDVDFTSVVESASWLTPVPGGVGPMTVAMVLRNTVTLAELARETTDG